MHSSMFGGDSAWRFIYSLQLAGNKIERLLTGSNVDRASWDYQAKGLQEETKLLK